MVALLGAAPKPPTCDANAKGVIWNFGTDAAPELKRCDGKAYVAYSVRCQDAAASGAYPAPPPAAPPTKQQCEKACEDTQKACTNHCNNGLVTDTQCVDRCNRSKVQCAVKC
ncbi:MAG: hypothetical protein JST54_05995 [Deltaproteobacteria bacterium]|nr:hypothetical protein [Deltaproteobacteria bacterium]